MPMLSEFATLRKSRFFDSITFTNETGVPNLQS